MYVPINVPVYNAAYLGFYAGIVAAGRNTTDPVVADYAAMAAAAGVWAQEFDTQWDSATTADGLQIPLIWQESYGVWEGRNTQSLTLSACTALVLGIIASITASEDYYASQAIIPPTWNTGGGGGGGVPDTPANSAGDLLTSTNTTGGALPALTSSAWLPSGGYAILSFSKNHGSSFEVGNTDVSPTFAASYNTTPSSAEIIYTQQPGSPLVLVTPYTAGQILETFTSNVNGATASFTLSADFPGPVTKTSTLTDTWGLPFLSIIDLVGNVVATQAYLTTMRGANPVQVHTSATGTYLAGQNVGAGQITAIALPTALDVGVVWTDNETGLPVTPNFVGTVAGYTNPFGVVVSMNLYTVGGIDVGTVSWSLS
jgi:hypothetical protein